MVISLKFLSARHSFFIFCFGSGYLHVFAKTNSMFFFLLSERSMLLSAPHVENELMNIPLTDARMFSTHSMTRHFSSGPFRCSFHPCTLKFFTIKKLYSPRRA